MNHWTDAEDELAKELSFRGSDEMVDRELLELAAKAAGYEKDVDGCYFESGFPTMISWNPLTDDGDALRLAVKLGMMVDVGSGGFCTADSEELESSVNEVVTPDPYAATRRAIVRAAAEIGKGMK